MHRWYVFFLMGLPVQSAIGGAEITGTMPVPATRQLSGLNAEEATALIAKLENAQRLLKAGQF